MSTLFPVLVAGAPLAAGWSAHTLWLRRRLHAARRDPLTGLHTRAGFEKAARRLLARRPAAVVMADLDGFKQINDTHGHAAGDAALIATAAALGELKDVHGGAVTARLGGDEFAAVLPVSDPVAVPWLLRGLHARVCGPVRLQGRTLTPGASVGGVHAPAGSDLAAALRVADEAMYTAKRAGGGWRTADLDGDRAPTLNGRRPGRPGTHHDNTEKAKGETAS